MGIIKKLIKYTLISVIILIPLFPFWIKLVPTKYILLFTGKVEMVDKYVCNFSTEVGGESMSPLIPSGSSLEMNRCFEEDDLTEGTIVLFYNNTNLRFGIIRHVLPLDPIVYKVSDEKAPELFHDIVKEEIIGINTNFDTSKSKYKAKQDAESFLLDPFEFLSDIYLAKIPRGSGIETSTVEKTSIFLLDKDKFCSVIIPRKNLTAVGTEIVNTKTQEIISSSANIVFNVQPEPNINCMDFGSEKGMLNLNPGSYQYKFSINHQALKNITFEVK